MAIPEYYNNYDQSNSNLKMVLSLIGKYKIPPNLININLVYEYVIGNNKSLIKVLDKLFSDPKNYTEQKAEELYKNYIWDDDKRTHEKLNNVLNKHFADILNSVKKANLDTSNTSHNLEKHSIELDTDASQEKIKDIVQNIISETKNALNINQTFEQELNQQENELERLKKELVQTKELAETDPLTNLKNRRAFDKSIKKNMDEALESDKPLSLIMLDIDFFKKVNDKYGHTIGDKVIRFVAKTLSDNIKGQDIAARIGGEEYAVLLPKTALNNSILWAEKLRHIIEDSKLIIPNTKEKMDQVTVSIGVTIYKPREDIENFINRADQALYLSKQNGRNKVSRIL